MFQSVVLRSLAQLRWGLVTQGHQHGTAVPGPSKLQSLGGVNEHGGFLWPPSPGHRTGQTLRVLLQPPSHAQAPGSHPPPVPTPCSGSGEGSVCVGLSGVVVEPFCCGCYF